jgi:DNA-binding CsgD family transcriptional regulator
VKLTPKQLDKLREAFRLSPREAEMVGLICAGATENKVLALRMGVTLGTAKDMLRSIYAKTRVSDKTQLVLFCFDAFHGRFRP